MKIAILYICTGKYDIFWKDFFISCEKYFHPKCQKEYFVFTDSNELYQEDSNKRIHKIFQENLGWPHNTLMRFHIFLKIEKELQEFDYIFFMNANIEFLKEVSFLPMKEQLVVVKHPGFYDKNPQDFTYDRNEKSLAYIPFKQDEENLFYGKIEGKYYVCGGFNGGGRLAYLTLIKTLAQNIQTDLDNNIIAIWHDESHLNAYIASKVEGEDFILLDPSFAYPQDWDIPFEKKVLIRDKKYYGGHNFLRGIAEKKKSKFYFLKAFFKKLFNKN